MGIKRAKKKASARSKKAKVSKNKSVKKKAPKKVKAVKKKINKKKLAKKKVSKKKVVNKKKVTKSAKKTSKVPKKGAKQKAPSKQAKKAAQSQKSIKNAAPRSEGTIIRKSSSSKGPQFLAAIAQINTRVGDLDANTKKIIATIKNAKDADAELIIFPELTITGYPPKDLLLRKDFIDTNLQKFIEIVSECRGITCVLGFANSVNGELRNSVAIIKDQKIIGIENKGKLPSHSYFDENKYFTEGKRAEIVVVGSKRIGIVVCPNLFEDQAHIERIANKGIDCLIAVGASPYAVHKPEDRERLGRLVAKKFEVPLVYCNSVGANDTLVFDGSSFMVDKKGAIVARAKKFAEDILLVNLNAKGQPFKPVVNQAEEVYQALTLGIRDYFSKIGLSKAVVGVSGGIDSAVTVALAAHALGPENVTALILPSKITSKESVQDANRICATLGIATKKISIDNIALQNARVLGLKYDKKNMSIAEQNMQARVRGQILLNFANKENAVVLTTINKSSLAIGYCVLNGDMAGTLAPLADLWKTQVYSVAEYMNAIHKRKHKKYLVPATIMKKDPSAELRPHQKDSEEVPPYDVLDRVLQFYIAHRKDIHAIAKLGFDAELVRRIALMVQRSQFKREHMPIALNISTTPLSSLVLPVVSGWRG